jgi:hypothetical protein
MVIFLRMPGLQNKTGTPRDGVPVTTNQLHQVQRQVPCSVRPDLY